MSKAPTFRGEGVLGGYGNTGGYALGYQLQGNEVALTANKVDQEMLKGEVNVLHQLEDYWFSQHKEKVEPTEYERLYAEALKQLDEEFPV